MGTAGRTQRFRELDGLRGIAASAVVVYHLLGGYDGKFPDEPASQWTFHWGAYGVQLFFMISGFVILMSARRAQRPVDFVISRVSRLYPAYWLAMAGTLLLAWGFGIYAAIHRPTVGEALANLTMVQRWLLVENVDQVYWTLAVEMQFYAVVFALLVLSRCTLSDRLIGWFAAAWCTLTTVVAVGVAPMTHGIAPNKTPFLAKIVLNLTVTPYAALFCAGMLAYLAWQGSRRWFWAAGAAGAAATLQYGLVQSWADAVVVAVLVVGFGAVVVAGQARWLRWRPVQWLGKISYSLYICHLALGVAVIHWLRPGLGRPLATLAALAAVLAWSALVHRLGEERGSRALKGWLTRRLAPRGQAQEA